jgi:hypothetical protein
VIVPTNEAKNTASKIKNITIILSDIGSSFQTYSFKTYSCS